MAFFAIPKFDQRFVVRNTFLEVTCDQEEFERESVQRRNRAFTDVCIGSDANFNEGIRSDVDTSVGQQSDAGSTSQSGSFCGESEEHVEAVAVALGASAEQFASEIRNPKVAAASVRVAALGVDIAVCTTVMFRNLPNTLTQVAILQVLEDKGFSALYDFAYLPVDFQKKVNFGYAVVNFITHEAAESAMQSFDGVKDWPMPGRKGCTMVWNVPCQGLAAQIEKYRDSPLMHPDVADEFKPMLFSSGLKMAFPLPTKQLKAPPRLQQKKLSQTKKQARKARWGSFAKAC